ncbi:maltooligosyl trehalose synthase [Tangfeifania diversioriginum]|uniref:Maltooligosyl trehalose synthase n=1 Tax=Tangfeifania diversioriginum TaxID=1168035 RepID=A0A1M6IQR6_9BACT|nr:malto-oligosyltrehalose synthase [Tangfeifania diversioriginum]SHJ36757.1 maltooligosyl trehalose synthase [Tangfeifania diversioriginum]
MYNPISTYRFQFNKEFTLKDAEQLIPYLQKSGVKTIYASPVFEAVKGSTHGYDVTNPLRINPEIGTEQDFENLVGKLHENGIGWVQDIVPNHMAFSPENPWIYDVLEKGRDSAFYNFFDIQETHPDENLNGKLMLPFFGKPLEQLIEDGELSIGLDENGFRLNYFDNCYPLSVPAYPKLLDAENRVHIPLTVAAFLNAERNIRNFDELRQKLVADYSESIKTKEYVDDCLHTANSDSERLKTIIDALYYYPSYWKDTETKINFRRFFTINGLICVNIQHEHVFEATHKLIANWVKNGLVDGVRIDHIDGLYNPGEYLERLRKLLGDKTYIVVEKILEKDEEIPADWPVEGTTGYDFLGMVNNLLTNPEKGPFFYEYYNEWIDKTDDFEDVFYKKNSFILYHRLKGELDNLTRECISLSAVMKTETDEKILKKAIGEFLVFCPIYKIYRSPSKFMDHEKSMVREIIGQAAEKNPALEKPLLLLEDLFLLKLPGMENEVPQTDRLFRHCMQFTGPLMAKGIEDTAFYSYNPFICHNEVGDSPSYFGIRTETFHNYMKERFEKMPLTMNVISSHDTKRGEDARARLNVLSDVPEAWVAATKEWHKLNRDFKQFDGNKEIPTPNDEYLIYQVLCAHFPMDAKIDESFKKRLEEYLVKAMREAKVNSSWSDPDEFYENETIAFVRKILSPDAKFPASLKRFMEEIIPHGITNSITQLILKNTLPGVPDTFQGTEKWNLSFVDPDNRREVDFEQLSADLDWIIKNYQTDAANLAESLWHQPLDGQLKQWMNWLTLNERNQYPDLFQQGSYTPFKVSGKYKKHIIAFSRKFGHQHLIVILPLNTASMPANPDWEDTLVELPGTNVLALENRLTKQTLEAEKALNVEDLFDVVPFGFLRNPK